MWDTCTIWTGIFAAVEEKNSTLQWRSQEHKVCSTCPRVTLFCWVYSVKSVPMACAPQQPQLCPSLSTPTWCRWDLLCLASLSLKLLWKWGRTVLRKEEVWAEELEWAFRWPHQIISINHGDKHSFEVHVLLIKSMDLWLKQVELMEFGENFVHVQVLSMSQHQVLNTLML